MANDFSELSPFVFGQAAEQASTAAQGKTGAMDAMPAAIPIAAPDVGEGPSQPTDNIVGVGPVGDPAPVMPPPQQPPMVQQTAEPTPAPQLAAPPPVQAKPPPGPPGPSPLVSSLSKEAAEIHQRKLEAVDTAANLEREKLNAVTLANDDARYNMGKQREADAAQAQQIAADAKKAADDRESAIQDFNKERKRDPHADVSVGQSILAAIAQGLGAFGAAMTGGQNTAAAIVAKAAEMRVRKWERDLDESKEAVKAKDNRVAYFRQLGMDHTAASRAALATLLDQAAEATDGIKAQYGSQEIQQRAEQVKIGLAEHRNQTMTAQAMADQNAKVKTWLASQPKQLSVRDQVTMRGLEVDVPQANGSKVRFYARSEPEAAKIRDAQKVAAGVKTDLLAMEALIKQYPSLNYQTSQQVETLNNSIRKKYIKLDELGVPTGKDLELSSVVGDPTKWTQTTGQTRELINRVRADMSDRLMNAYVVQGFEGAP